MKGRVLGIWNSALNKCGKTKQLQTFRFDKDIIHNSLSKKVLVFAKRRLADWISLSRSAFARPLIKPLHFLDLYMSGFLQEMRHAFII